MTVMIIYDAVDWNDAMDPALHQRIKHYGECLIFRGLTFNLNGDMCSYLEIRYDQILSESMCRLWNIEFSQLLVEPTLLTAILKEINQPIRMGR